MPHSTKYRLVIALPVLFLLLVGVGALVVFFDSEPDIPPPKEPGDWTAPFDVPTEWNDLTATSTIRISTDDAPAWNNQAGTTLLYGPFVEGLSTQWSQHETEGWTVLVGDGSRDDTAVQIRLWTTPGFPLVIIDIDATIQGTALAEPLSVTTSIPDPGIDIIEGSIVARSIAPSDEGNPTLLAASNSAIDPALQLYSPDGATGRAQSADATDETHIEWTVWHGLAELSDCPEPSDASHQTSLRLVAQFGDQPLVGPLPVPAHTRSAGLPIFVDAPAVSDDAWSDGRARHVEDLASRFRALAYGHSNRDDPRYGNGGLLAAGLGALFGVPDEWWNEAPIQTLRQSLEDTEIDVVRRSALVDDLTDHSTGRIIDGDECSIMASLTDGAPLTQALAPRDDDVIFETGLTTPLPPTLRAGMATTDRTTLLDRLFATNRHEGLLMDGALRALFIPVVASRNPLEEISSHNLLTAERNGQWTLDDTLNRRLTRFELTADEATRFMGLSELTAHRQRHRTLIPYWGLDGQLQLTSAEDAHLFFSGDLAQTSIDGHSLSAPLAVEHFEPPQQLHFDGPIDPIAIEIH